MLARRRQGSSSSRVAGRGRLYAAVVTAACLLCGIAATVALATPEYVLPPEVVGKPRVGERLVCSSGTWKGAPHFEYEWVREGIEIVHNSPTYTLSKADEHKEVWCIVTARVGVEEGFAESINGICLGGGCGAIQEEAPVNEKKPSISPAGTQKVGTTLTCSPGVWKGKPSPTFSYKWYRDKSEAIAGATGIEYKIVGEDETHNLSCRVTGTNGAGSATAESENEVQVPGSPPKPTKGPEVLGVARVGETLTCSEGTWTGSRPLTFKFQWLRGGVEIKGATGNTHLVEKEDAGKSLSCKVTAENKEGKAEALSAAVTVATEKLKDLEAPKITGIPEENQTLKCSEGVWNLSESERVLPSKFQWLREGTETILGATSSTYKVASADKGHLLYCQVTAKSKTGGEEVSALSEAVGVKNKAGVPKNLSAPEVSGTLELGKKLTCSEGNWTASPTSYAFQWLREKSPISGATGSEYSLKAADQGHSVSCKVIALNGEGPSEPAESVELYVSGEAPSATTLPEVIGAAKPRVGESLTCARGEWKGAPPPTFQYEWLRDHEVVGSGVAYTLSNGDRGHSMACRVKATNVESSAEAESSNAIYVPGVPPGPPLEATIAGEPTVGSTLTCVEGTWTGAPPPKFTFQWLLNGAPIPGATKATFEVVSADRGYALSCKVTGTNSEGSESVSSKPVLVAGVAPKAEVLPLVEGGGFVGGTITCNRGIWSGKPPPSFEYQWYRDGSAIPGATEETYVVEAADQGHLLSCNVLARNSVSSAEEESSNALAISAARIAQNGGGGVAGSHAVKLTQPSRGIILASIKRQLKAALEGAHLTKILKAGSFNFSFIAPWEGKFETLWYVVGKEGGKTKQIVFAQAKNSFPGIKKATVKLKLTVKGKSALAGKKRYSLKLKGVFTIPHQKPVTWAVTIVLNR